MKILQLDDSNSKRMEIQSVLKRMGIRGSLWVRSVEEGIAAVVEFFVLSEEEPQRV